MDKYNALYEKLNALKMETETAISQIDNDEVREYLNKYKENIVRLMNLTNNKSIPDSKGGLLGVLRGISEFDDLAAIDSLYNSAYAAENFYSNECKKF